MVAQISTAKVRWHQQALCRGVCCPAGAAARWLAVNYAVKKRVNSPPRAIDHPKDLKSVYTTSGKGARRSREYNCLVLSQCGSAFGVCELTEPPPAYPEHREKRRTITDSCNPRSTISTIIRPKVMIPIRLPVPRPLTTMLHYLRRFL